MEQGDQSVQAITEKFENVWRSAYPSDTSTDSPYKMHNYLRILQPRIASAVGLQSPYNYEAAKDIALKVETYLPRIPTARLFSLETEEPNPSKSENYLHTLVTTASQQTTHEISAIQSTMQELKQDLSDMKAVLNNPTTKYTNRYEPYTSNRPLLHNRYANAICDACGRQGHIKTYKGCPQHPEHDPNRAQRDTNPLN